MFRATLVYVEIILKILQSRDQAEPALVAQWRMSLSAVRLAYVAARLRRSGFNSRLRRFVGTCIGQLSAYSEINISGKHRGFDDVLFSL